MLSFFYFLFPKRFYTRLMLGMSGFKSLYLKRLFVKLAGIDLSTAVLKHPSDYRNIQEIFTRRLDVKQRTWVNDSSVLTLPVDGCLLAYGKIFSKKALQVKGIEYNVHSLLGELWDGEEGGMFANFYLSPKDYHGFHLPCDGTLLRILHIPGALYPVQKALTYKMPGLYTGNERVVFEFQHPTHLFKWYLVAIGAMGVGSMAMLYNNQATIIKNNTPFIELPINMKQNDQLGYFCFGSSVVLLFNTSVDWLVEEGNTQCSNALANLTNN